MIRGMRWRFRRRYHVALKFMGWERGLFIEQCLHRISSCFTTCTEKGGDSHNPFEVRVELQLQYRPALECFQDWEVARHNQNSKDETTPQPIFDVKLGEIKGASQIYNPFKRSIELDHTFLGSCGRCSFVYRWKRSAQSSYAEGHIEDNSEMTAFLRDASHWR